MTKETFTVKKYKEYLGHTMESTVEGQAIKYRGVLVCKGVFHTLYLFFLTEGSPVPKCIYLHADKAGYIYLPFKDMPSYVDMLRNEKPVYAYVDSDNPQWNHLRTGVEPTGEAERYPAPPDFSTMEFRRHI